ncbi:MAG: hypothetical protein ACRDTC_06790, partial [Pseudonocardiaceae bacterium]
LFQSLSKPVTKAVDWIVGKIAAFGKKIWAKIKAPGKKLKDKLQDRFRGKDKSGVDKRTDDAKRHALDAGLDEADALVRQRMPREDIEQRLPAIKGKHGMQSLRLVITGHRQHDDIVHVTGRVNPVGKRVDAPVPGLYESVDPNEKERESFRFSGAKVKRLGADSIQMRTDVQYLVDKNIKGNGYVTNVFQLDGHAMTMEEHFLDAIPAVKRWITAPDKPLVVGQGTPLVTYVNLRQMRKFEELAGNDAVKAVKQELRRQGLPGRIDAAEEAKIRKGQGLYGKLKRVTLDTVENLHALLQLHQELNLRPGVDVNEAIMHTHSVQYVSTIIIQAGGRIKSATVGPGTTKALGSLMGFREKSATPARRQEVRDYHESLLVDFGVTRQTPILMGFNVDLQIDPFHSTGAS